MYIHNQIDIIRQPFNEGKKKKAIQILCNDKTKNFLNAAKMTPFTSADNYYYAQRIVKKFAKEPCSQKNLCITKDFEDKQQLPDNVKSDQSNSEIPKIQTSKYNQILSIGIRGERIQVRKEFPSILSSQNKEPSSKPKLTNRIFNLKKNYRTEAFEPQSENMRKQNFEFSLDRSQDILNKKCIRGSNRNDEYSIYSQNTKNISLHKEESARDLTSLGTVSHHSSKPSNLKINLRYNKNINLDTLLEQNNVFYLKYKAVGHQSNRISIGNKTLSPNKSESDLTLTMDQMKSNKIILNPFKFQQKIKQEKKSFDFEKSITHHQNNDFKLGETSSLNSLLVFEDRARNSLKDLDYLNEKFLKSTNQQNFPTYGLQKISQIQRMGNLPNLILILHIDGLLGFFKTSLFGFSKYLTNSLSHMDIQNQLNRQFIEVKVNEEDQEAFYMSKQLKQVVKNLSRAYIIIFIINKEYSKFFQPIVAQLKEKKIFYDAFYSVDYSGSMKYLVTDYQEILVDFDIQDPKLILIANSIDIDDVDNLFVNSNYQFKHFKQHYYNQVQSLNSDSFAQNIKILRQASFNSKNIDLFYGMFPKAGICSQNILRTILFEKISFFALVEIIKTSSRIPTLDKLEQVCVAIMNDYSFLNLLYEQKNNFIRCQFTRLFNRYKINNQIKKNTNKILFSKQKEIQNQLQIELEQENDLYMPEFAELEFIESKKRLNFNLQNKIYRMDKRLKRRKSLQEQSFQDLQFNIQSLIEDLFTKNRPIFKHILKNRIFTKQQIQGLHKMEKLEQYQKYLNFIDNEIEYCYQYNDLILFCITLN